MQQTRLTDALTWMFAIQDWRGALKRIAAISVALILIGRGMEYAIPSEMIAPFYISAMRTLLTLMPFMFVVFYIVTQLELTRLTLVHSANTDMLTGLRNRAAFFEQATRAHEVTGGSVLLMIDADFFKRVNDLYGHAAGDHTLRAIARRLRSMVREEDIIGRLGGEEFAILLPGITLAQAVQIGVRMSKGLDVALEPDGHLLAMTLSVGAVEMPADMTLDTALIHADEALYRAKSLGRARLELWLPEEAA